jgi:RNA polymerase sigma factor (sigma-70 family)
VEPTGRDDAQLVTAARTDEPEAFGPLAQRWFDRCYDLAWHVLHDRELAADVAQDALLTAWQRLDRLERPESFGGWLLRITRNRALDVLRREVRTVPTDDATRLEPREDDTTAIGDPVAAHARAQEHDLVWAAAAALGPRDASILDLHLRHGLEPHELATELGIAPNAAHQALFRLRKRLAAAIRAWLVWRGGEPDCVVLRAELVAAALDRFGPQVVRTVDRHAASCEDCAQARDRVTAPASLFSVVPLAVAPVAMRQVRFERLAEAGVPVDARAEASASTVEAPAVDRAPSPADVLASAGGHANRSHVLAAVAAIVAAVVLVGGWAVRGDGGPPVPAGPAAEAGSAPQAGATADLTELPPLPEFLGILPEGAAVAPRPPTADPSDQRAGGAPGADGLELGDGGPAGEEAEGGRTDTGTPTARPSDEEPTDPSPPSSSPPDPADGDPLPDDPGGDDDPADPTVAPTIASLEVAVVGACADGTLQHEVRWRTSDAEEVTLQAAEGAPADVPTSGEVLACAPRGSTFTLTASGPGGTATRTATAG